MTPLATARICGVDGSCAPASRSGCPDCAQRSPCCGWRPPECIDRLGVVADHHHAGGVARHRFEDVGLQDVGVLVLVDENMIEQTPECRTATRARRSERLGSRTARTRRDQRRAAYLRAGPRRQVRPPRLRGDRCGPRAGRGARGRGRAVGFLDHLAAALDWASPASRPQLLAHLIALRKLLTPKRRRRAVGALVDRFGVSERRACRVVGQHRST
jgi:hypothetical protein